MDRHSIFRLAAVLLLLLTGVDLVACELLEPGRCESFGVPAGGESSQQPDDKCICCCTHALTVAIRPASVVLGEVEVLEFERPSAATREPSAIYHPPRT